MTIEELILDYERKILFLKKRYYYITAFIDELTKRTDGKPFDIKNDILWQMMTDSYAMLIVDLASLYKNLGEQGGFCRRIPRIEYGIRREDYGPLNPT